MLDDDDDYSPEELDSIAMWKRYFRFLRATSPRRTAITQALVEARIATAGEVLTDAQEARLQSVRSTYGSLILSGKVPNEDAQTISAEFVMGDITGSGANLRLRPPLHRSDRHE